METALVPLKKVSVFRKNRTLLPGLILLLAVILPSLYGQFFVPARATRILADKPNLPPSASHIFGTQAEGRDVFALLLVGTPGTLRIGLIGGLVGLSIGTALGLISGYNKGWLDAIIRILVDVALTIPALAILILIAATFRGLSISSMGLVVALTSWMQTTRVIRSQVLSLRERSFIQMAKLSGVNDLLIVFREILPNLIPFVAASFVDAVATAILSSIGLEILGLGSQQNQTLGNTIYFSIYYSALWRGIWWWWLPPVFILIAIFLGLFLVSIALDEYSNPAPAAIGIKHAKTRDSRRMQCTGSQPDASPTTRGGALGMSEVILDVQNLSINYYTLAGVKKAVNQVNFQIFKDEIFGLVGESGSGKSTLCYGLLRLVPPPGKIDSGVMNFYGENLLALQGEKLRQTRWRDISFIPQGAMSSLNPVARIREQMADAILDHETRQSRTVVNRRIDAMLERVNLPVSVANKFPHELSGGMKQRVCIALAVILKPKLILADEPTSALDVVSQRIVLEMLSEVRQSLQASMILVGHDMALQAQVAHRLGIMYGGSFMEIGTVRDIFDDPIHPYTQRLISSIPSIRKKQDIHSLAQNSYTEVEKSQYVLGNTLVEVKPGHYAAVYNG